MTAYSVLVDIELPEVLKVKRVNKNGPICNVYIGQHLTNLPVSCHLAILHHYNSTTVAHWQA